MNNIQRDIENLICEIQQFDRRILDHNRYYSQFFDRTKQNVEILTNNSESINEIIDGIVKHLSELKGILTNEK
jgi:uncharacterized protein YaaN involved in tellurite resistance